MEVYLRIKGIYDEPLSVKISAMYFGDYAKSWWTTHDTQIGLGKEDPIANFETFKAVLRERFRPENNEREAREALLHLRQTGRVRDYSRQFCELIQDLPNMDTQDQIYRYVRGLHWI